jgi:hypothetical protein
MPLVQVGFYVNHGRIIHVHSFLRVSSAVLVVKIDAGIVDEHIYTAVLCDFFCEVPDAGAVCDIELGVYYTASGVIRL